MLVCAVCREEWCAHGVLRDGSGDMLAWEAVLFLRGQGCPGCEGVSPDGEPVDVLAWGGSLITSALDSPGGHQDLALGEGRAEDLPERFDGSQWHPPEPKVLWSCAGCGVRVLESVERWGEREHDLPRGAPGRDWYRSHPYRRWYDEYHDGNYGPPAEPYADIGGVKVCEWCHASCGGCGADVSPTIETGDVYDPGWCHGLEGQDWRAVFCIECVEAQCHTCLEIGGDCTCAECPGCGEVFDASHQDRCDGCEAGADD